MSRPCVCEVDYDADTDHWFAVCGECSWACSGPGDGPGKAGVMDRADRHELIYLMKAEERS
jgi:hypothetical protein